MRKRFGTYPLFVVLHELRFAQYVTMYQVIGCSPTYRNFLEILCIIVKCRQRCKSSVHVCQSFVNAKFRHIVNIFVMGQAT